MSRRKTKERNKKDHNNLYNLQYLNPGTYPIKLQMRERDSTKTVILKDCVKIKPGVVNYIGDFYWSIGKEKMISPLHTLFLHQETFDTAVRFENNQKDAKIFMLKSYPKLMLKVPFLVTDLSVNNCK